MTANNRAPFQFCVLLLWDALLFVPLSWLWWGIASDSHWLRDVAYFGKGVLWIVLRSEFQRRFMQADPAGALDAEKRFSTWDFWKFSLFMPVPLWIALFDVPSIDLTHRISAIAIVVALGGIAIRQLYLRMIGAGTANSTEERA